MTTNLGFRAEVSYDAVKDLTLMSSSSSDFSSPLSFALTRGSNEDKAVRALLEDQGRVEFVKSTVPLNNLSQVGSFGVRTDGHPSRADLGVHKNLLIAGKDGSGVLNFVRNYLLWAYATNTRIYAVNAPADMYGAANYLRTDKVVRIDSGDEPNMDSIWSQYDADVTAGRPVLVLVNSIGDIEDQDDVVASFLAHVDTRKFEVYALSFSTFQEELPEDTHYENFFWRVGVDAEHTTGFIGDTLPEIASYMMKEHVGIPHENPRGVLWLNKNAERYERVVTYLVPRRFWEDSLNF